MCPGNQSTRWLGKVAVQAYNFGRAIVKSDAVIVNQKELKFTSIMGYITYNIHPSMFKFDMERFLTTPNLVSKFGEDRRFFSFIYL